MLLVPIVSALGAKVGWQPLRGQPGLLKMYIKEQGMVTYAMQCNPYTREAEVGRLAQFEANMGYKVWDTVSKATRK